MAVTLDPVSSPTKNSKPTFSGTGGTAPGDLGTVTVLIYSGPAATGTPVRSLPVSLTSGSYSVAPTTALVDGTYTAQTTQSDLAGDTGTSAPRTFLADTVAPTASLTTAPPTINAASAGGSSTSLTVTYADSGSGINTASLSASNVAVSNGAAVSGFSRNGNAVTYTITAPSGSLPAGTILDAGVPSGSVTFYANGNPLRTVNLRGGTASYSTSTLPAGSDTITASYSGDANFAPASTSRVQTVNAAATSVALISSANPSVFGRQVTFTATVSAVAPGGGTPNGTVTFYADSSLLGPAVKLDSNGKGVFTTSALNVGRRTITAVYAGSTSFSGSNGNMILAVNL
ncbi:MAG: Ig-like domain repeat protein [Thermoguttaceae bacterium]